MVDKMSGVKKYTNFRFKVEIDGIDGASFSKASGAEVETDITEYEEGGYNEFTHKFHNRKKYSNLVLERGIINSKQILDWLMDNSGTSVTLKKITISTTNNLKEKITWTFKDCYPVKWSSGEFDGSGNSVLIEKVEIAHKGFTMDC